jgi:hypothetical protein
VQWNWVDEMHAVPAARQPRRVVARAATGVEYHRRRRGKKAHEQLFGPRTLEQTFAITESRLLQASRVVGQNVV